MSVGSLLRKHSNSLAGAIDHPNIVASALYSKNIITRASLEEASIESKIPSARAIDLLMAVARVVESEPWKFETFLDVLKEELENDTLLDQIQQDYDDLPKGDNVETAHDNGNIRHRHTKGEEHQDHEEEEAEEEVSTSAIIRVVVKGVGSVMLLSLLMWLVFVFIYKPPDNPVTPSGSSYAAGKKKKKTDSQKNKGINKHKLIISARTS